MENVNEIPVLDLATLSPLVNLMSQAQLETLIEALNSTLSRTIPEISQKNISFERAATLGHDIKGMSANIGMVRLSAYAFEIEKKCRDQIECFEERRNIEKIAEESLSALAVFLEKQGHKNNPDYFHLRIDRSS